VSDYRWLLASRLLRSFGFGFSAVLLGVHLERRGLSATWIGLTLTLALATATLSGLLLAQLSRRVTRRGTLALCGVLMALSGLDLALPAPPWLLLVSGLTGMLGTGADQGPFAAVEQAMLSESATPAGRNRSFGRYSLTGGLAGTAGALLATAGVDNRATSLLFALYAVLGLVTAALPLRMSERVEGDRGGRVFGSLRPLLALSALFAVDSFGGGFIVQSVVSYWLHVRFGAGSDVLGPAFAAMSLLQAASYEASSRLADRIGLVNTMVLTHLPSNVLLLFVAFSPNLAWALGLLIVRYSISQMDVPARQAYVVSIVKPGERAGAVAVTNAVRGVAQAAGPVLAGLALQAAAFGLPFIAGGSVKIAYDLGLYAGFRTRRAEHERRS
jgi:MFS family permease